MSNKTINVTCPYLPSYEEYTEEIKSLWDSRWLTNFGHKHQELKAILNKYLVNDDILLMTNGHLALEMCLEALETKGEVITTPYTFISTTHAIVRSGMTPVFCDINEDDYTIDVNKIEELINENTVAIMPVHVYGNICDVERLKEIAEKHNLKVIYDAAHAFGARYKGIPVTNYGDLSMLSLHATKVFHTVEGGGVIVNNKKYTDVLRKLKQFGQNGEDCELAGTNAKMSEFHAAMGICNMRHINDIIAIRKERYEKYLELLNGLDGIKLNYIAEDVDSNYSYFPIFIDEKITGFNRDMLLEELQKNNIFARKYFYPICSEMSAFKDMTKNETPIAKRISLGILTLPLYVDMEIDDVKAICEVVVSFHKSFKTK